MQIRKMMRSQSSGTFLSDRQSDSMSKDRRDSMLHYANKVRQQCKLFIAQKL